MFFHLSCSSSWPSLLFVLLKISSTSVGLRDLVPQLFDLKFEQKSFPLILRNVREVFLSDTPMIMLFGMQFMDSRHHPLLSQVRSDLWVWLWQMVEEKMGPTGLEVSFVVDENLYHRRDWSLEIRGASLE